jgi:SAM-dependent methyltransferase
MALSYFEQLYAADPDPWGFEDRWYERRKHALTVASLPRPSYSRGFEPACANGRLTSLLAPLCAQLLAIDAVAAAVARTRERMGDQPHVVVEKRLLPQEWPEGTFDLVVLSEFLYYFDATELAAVLTLVLSSLEPEGTLLAVHWRHRVPEYPLSGDEVHSALISHPALARLGRHEEEDFLLDVMVRRGDSGPAVSVAAASGLLDGRGQR